MRYKKKSSINSIGFNQLIIKLYDSSSDEDQQTIIQAFKENPNTYRYRFDLQDNVTLDNVDGIVTLVFDIVIIITMFLCFFSLSSSMTSNLYE